MTLFEADSRIGGHTNTVDVTHQGRTWSIDTGFIVYNDRTYPNFIALLESLGVDSKPTIMSFSVHDEASGLEYNGHSPDTLFAQRSNLFRPRFHKLRSAESGHPVRSGGRRSPIRASSSGTST